MVSQQDNCKKTSSPVQTPYWVIPSSFQTPLTGLKHTCSSSSKAGMCRPLSSEAFIWSSDQASLEGMFITMSFLEPCVAILLKKKKNRELPLKCELYKVIFNVWYFESLVSGYLWTTYALKCVNEEQITLCIGLTRHGLYLTDSHFLYAKFWLQGSCHKANLSAGWVGQLAGVLICCYLAALCLLWYLQDALFHSMHSSKMSGVKMPPQSYQSFKVPYITTSAIKIKRMLL